MSDLVGNPEDRFSHNESHIYHNNLYDVDVLRSKDSMAAPALRQYNDNKPVMPQHLDRQANMCRPRSDCSPFNSSVLHKFLIKLTSLFKFKLSDKASTISADPDQTAPALGLHCLPFHSAALH